MRWFVGVRQTRRTGGSADTFLIEQDKQRLRFNALKSYIGGGGQSLSLVTVQFGFQNGIQDAIFQRVPQWTHRLVVIGQMLPCQFSSFAHADKPSRSTGRYVTR